MTARASPTLAVYKTLLKPFFDSASSFSARADFFPPAAPAAELELLRLRVVPRVMKDMIFSLLLPEDRRFSRVEVALVEGLWLLLLPLLAELEEEEDSNALLLVSG